MTDKIRLRTVLTKFNVSLQRVVSFLHTKNIEIEKNPNIKIDKNIYQLLVDEFRSDKEAREASERIILQRKKEKEKIREELLKNKTNLKSNNLFTINTNRLKGPKTFGKIDLKNIEYKRNKNIYPKKNNIGSLNKLNVKNVDNFKYKINDNKTSSSEEKLIKEKQKKPQHIKTQYQKLTGLMFTGDKVDLSQFEKKRSTIYYPDNKKKKRKRIKKEIKFNSLNFINNINNSNNINSNNYNNTNSNNVKKHDKKNNITRQKKTNKKYSKIENITNEQIQKQIKETLEKLESKKGKSRLSKIRKEKRKSRKEKIALQNNINIEKSKILKIAEFATVNELSAMMNVPETKVILTCMSLGIMATMNQRLDAETITLIVDEFGYGVEFVGISQEENIKDIEDKKEDLVLRSPIVTVMGHVDHGKTSLLDYIRKTNIINKEQGGITQHIGVYNVNINKNKNITFLDTPGHEAFTAMRSRGAQITDIIIIVVASDDKIMPQTKESINHAKLAGVPMIFAINKIDKPSAQPEKIREQLANMNILLEEWGGGYQSQEISTKTGLGINKLLEKIILESEILDLKANPKRSALGTVIEASLDKGRGYITTIIIQNGSLKISDYILAGIYHGKIKVILDELGNNLIEAGPSKPVIILGLNGAPTAGDKFRVFKDEKEAKNIASYRGQLKREQNIRSQKHLTLDEIGRRINLGNFKEIKIILKGDVDGSVEALSDSLQKLSTKNIIINIIHKGVGQIIESDVLLAGTSNAIIIGFNVKPVTNAKNIAEKENIEIRTYSIIYDAINSIEKSIKEFSEPEIKENILGFAEVREIFKITKVGVVAGCMVKEGKLLRNSKIRIIRDSSIVYNGELISIRRFKEDIKESLKGYECGISIKNYESFQVKDIIESYEEIKKNLSKK